MDPAHRRTLTPAPAIPARTAIDPGNRPRPGSVAVIAKATAIFDRLAAEGETTPARLSELIDEPRSTVYRLLSTLQELGYVEPGSRRGTYRLTLKLFTLGSAVVSRFDEREAAHPVMERLHAQTGETIFLCVRRGLQAVCIERIAGTRVALLALALGGALPLHLGAAPRALLAFEPEDFWHEYLAHVELEEPTPDSPHGAAGVIAELRSTREHGYSISDQDVTIGVASIGAPIFGHTGSVRASLSIGGLRETVMADREQAIELVVAAAREVSRALGHRP